MDKLKKEMIDRCSLKEMLGLKKQLVQEMSNKVDLKEVQQVLNECQTDLSEQLAQFKQSVQDKQIAQEISLTRLIDRKADHKDLKQMHDDKVNKLELHAQYVPRKEFDELKINSDGVFRDITEMVTKD